MNFMWRRLLVNLAAAVAAMACCAAGANATTYAVTATLVDDSSWRDCCPSVFTLDSLTVAPAGAPSRISAFAAQFRPAEVTPAPQVTGWSVDISREIWKNTQHTWLSARSPWPVEPAICDLADVPGSSTIGGVKAADLETLFNLMPQGTGATPDQASAFGAAISQVVNEISAANGDGFNGDNTLLTGVTFQNTQSVYGMYSIDTQNISFSVSEGSSPVPEPITFLSGLLVVSGLGYYVRRRTRLASARP
jgi:hypothetical protein